MKNRLEEFSKGWSVVLASAMGVGVGITGLPFYTFGVFIKPLSAEFGWSRGGIAAGMLFLNAGAFFTGPFIGKLIDRHGIRIVAPASLFGLAIGFFALSLVGHNLSGFYAAWLLLSVMGCATTPLTWTRAVSLNFDRARGIALGLTLLGTGLASIFGPMLLQMLIKEHGWRGGYAGMGAFVALVALPVVLLGLRGNKQARPDAVTSALPGMSYREGLRSRRFWLIGIGIFCVIFSQASATVHLVPLLSDRGISPGVAAAIASLLGVSVVVGRIVIGFLLDRFAAPKIARVALVLPAIALLLLLTSVGPISATMATILLGLAAGAEVDLLAYLVSRYFGMRSYGVIYGTMLSMFSLGAAIGPVIAGRVYDASGSYDRALLGGICLFLTGAAAIGFLGDYPKFELETADVPRI